MKPSPLDDALEDGATYLLIDEDKYTFYRTLKNGRTQERTASAFKWLGRWKYCSDIPLEAQTIESVSGEYKSVHEDAVGELDSNVEEKLLEDSTRNFVRFDWRYNWKVFRQGYVTADLALIFGYIYVLLPKVVALISAFLWVLRAERNDKSSTLVVIGAAVVLNLWDWLVARIWLRWVSRSILPEEAKTFYLLDPMWFLISQKTWEKLIADVNDQNEAPDEDQ